MRILKLIVLVLIMGFSQTKAQSRIMNFTTLALKDSVRLTFSISTGSSCAGYQILHGSDSLNLQPLYSYPGICGNLTFPELHTYTDFSPNKLSPNFYQIYIPPNDYSMVKRVDVASSFSNLLIFPQPAESTLNVAINNLKSYYFEMNIYDRFGRKKGFVSGNAGDRITFDVSSLEYGVYAFYIVTGTGGAYKGKFLKSGP